MNWTIVCTRLSLQLGELASLSGKQSMNRCQELDGDKLSSNIGINRLNKLTNTGKGSASYHWVRSVFPAIGQ